MSRPEPVHDPNALKTLGCPRGAQLLTSICVNGGAVRIDACGLPVIDWETIPDLRLQRYLEEQAEIYSQELAAAVRVHQDVCENPHVHAQLCKRSIHRLLGGWVWNLSAN